MKVYIKEGAGRRFFIPVPLSLLRFALLLGNVGIRIARKYVDEQTLRYMESVDLKQLSSNIKYLRSYKGLTIVEVRSADGDEVVIKI
jgi:hypothetical protein